VESSDIVLLIINFGARRR